MLSREEILNPPHFSGEEAHKCPHCGRITEMQVITKGDTTVYCCVHHCGRLYKKEKNGSFTDISSDWEERKRLGLLEEKLFV